MRTQTYIFLQKLKCPKCGRILAGGASHKIKYDKWYFYYRCENCKNNIHEDKIEDKIKVLLADILEYDNVVNEFFLPVLKSKVDNPKEQLEKELLKEEQKLSKAKEDEYKQIEWQRKMAMDNLSLDLSIQKENQNKLIKEVDKLKETKEKISILFIASNPDIEFIDDDGNTVQQQKLKLEKEAREIHESIQKSLKRDSISFETRWATRVTDLLQFINEVNPTILHFSGHGTSDGKLVFQDNNDKPKLLSMDALVELINASSDNLRLVVLNNCFSSILSEKIVDNIEASIGMNNTIGDQAAIVFASQLYSSIGFGLSLEKAFQQAIVALKLYEISEEQTPQLYLSNGIEAKDIYLVTKN